MKKVIIIFILIVGFQFVNAQKSTPSWLLKEERIIPKPYLTEHFLLNGKVKDIKLMMSGKLVDEWTFDTNGKLTKNSSYSNGIFQSSTEYDYSKKDQISIQYLIGGKKFSPVILKLDSKGNVMSESHYNNEGKLNRQMLYKYNNAGLLLNTDKSMNSEVQNVSTYIYDKNNLLINYGENITYSYEFLNDKIKITKKYSPENIDRHSTKIYDLDKSGKNILYENTIYTTYNSENKYDYTFDSKNNWIIQNIVCGTCKGKALVMTREISYY